MGVRLALPLLAVLVGCATPPPDQPDVDAYRSTLEFNLLKDTTEFHEWTEGQGGFVPDQVIAYRVVLRRPDATAAFEALLREGQSGGRVYAIFGLSDLAPERLDDAIERLRLDRGESIQIVIGCEESTLRIEDVASRAREGEFTRALRGDGSSWRQGGSATTHAGFAATEWIERLAAIQGTEEPTTLEADEEAPEEDDGEPEEELGAYERRARRDPSAPIQRLEWEQRNDPHRRERAGAVEALVAIGPPAIPELRRALQIGNTQVRLGILEALRGFGPWDRPLAPAVAALLTDPHRFVRLLATSTLAYDREAARSVGPALVRALGRVEPEVGITRTLLEGIANLDPTPDAVLHLARLLAHEHPWIRSDAANVLASYGRVAAPAKAELTAALIACDPERDDWEAFLRPILGLGHDLARECLVGAVANLRGPALEGARTALERLDEDRSANPGR